MKILDDICKIIRDEYGPVTAITVYAALEVALARWTPEDTVSYGTKMLENLKHINLER